MTGAADPKRDWQDTEVLGSSHDVLVYYGELLRQEGRKLHHTARQHLRRCGLRYATAEDADDVVNEAIARLAAKAEGGMEVRRHPGLLYRQLWFSASEAARRGKRDQRHAPHPDDDRSHPELADVDSPPEVDRTVARRIAALRPAAIAAIRRSCVPSHGGAGLTEGRWHAFVRTELHRYGFDLAEPPDNRVHQNARRARNAIAPVVASVLREALSHLTDDADAIDEAIWSTEHLSEIVAFLGLVNFSWQDLEHG